MQHFFTIESRPFKVVLVTVSQSWKSGTKLKLTVKDTCATREEAEASKAKMLSRIHTHEKPDYRVVDEVGYRRLTKKVAKDRTRRLEEGKAKATATRAKNVASGKKPKAPTRVACPVKGCGCKTSKVLFSEMGGLQHRKCKKGHRFTFDKWIADRAFWNPAAITKVYGKEP